MRDKLISYIDLLFAGNPDTEDIKQEILQNTLDRYDDLIAQGKTPEAAYTLAISGIGDVSEIIGKNVSGKNASAAAEVPSAGSEQKNKTRKAVHAIAIALYILCPIPLFVLQDELGLCLLLLIVAIATALNILVGTSVSVRVSTSGDAQMTPEQKLRRSIHSAVFTVGLVFYFGISFATDAWSITWLVFPIIGAVNGLISACMDLKEAK